MSQRVTKHDVDIAEIGFKREQLAARVHLRSMMIRWAGRALCILAGIPIADRALDSFDRAVGKNTHLDISITISVTISIALAVTTVVHRARMRAQSRELKRLRSRIDELQTGRA